MKIVENPNLPENAEAVIIGEKYRKKLEKGLEKASVRVIWMPPNSDIDNRLSCHADLSVLNTGKGELLLAPCLKGSIFERQLSGEGFKLSFPDIVQAPVYPEDAQMNICIVGKKAILNIKSVPDSIVNVLTNKRGLGLLDSRQGYSRCSICVVDDNSLITSDEGLYRKLTEKGYDVLKIQPGSIDLEGYKYGFIGGASFKISKSKLAFTGLLDAHPDENRILSFLSLHNIEPIFLSNEKLFDIGSAIPITEK